MKKTFLTVIGIVMLTVFAVIAAAPTAALAAEQELSCKITGKTINQDKNGNPYMRFMAYEQKRLNGTPYTVGVPVMIFSQSAPDAFKVLSAKREGDPVKLIVQPREYQGRTSYTVLAVADTPAAKVQ